MGPDTVRLAIYAVMICAILGMELAAAIAGVSVPIHAGTDALALVGGIAALSLNAKRPGGEK